jgi:HEAT repeat protein
VNEIAEEARQGNATALKSLHIVTQDSQVPMRQSAYEALGMLANIDPKARELILSMAKDKSPLVRKFTVIALGSKALRKRELLTVLLEAAKDSDPTVREAAANSLIVSALRSNEEATLTLANLAENDPVDSVKRAAILALAHSSTAGNTKVLEILKKLTSHSNPVISQAAQAALAGVPHS